MTRASKTVSLIAAVAVAMPTFWIQPAMAIPNTGPGPFGQAISQLFGGKFTASGATTGQTMVFNSTTGWAPGTPSAGTSLAADGTAGAPAFSFSNNTDRGLYNDTTNTGIGFSVGGLQVGYWTASIHAQRSGTTAQATQIYNTFTSATNYERLAIDWQTTSNLCQLYTTYGTAGGSPRTLVIGGNSLATDVVGINTVVKGISAYPQAASNLGGSNLLLAGGTGRRIYTVLIYTNLALKTVTITVNGNSTVKTEGTNWTAATSNNATATSLATAISAVSGVSATAVGAVVYIQPNPDTSTLTIATNATSGDMTATQSNDGAVVLGTPSNNLPAIVFGGTTSSFCGFVSGGTTLKLRLGDASGFASFSCAGIQLSGLVTQYSGSNTAGWGVPAIYAQANATTQSAANSSVATYTPSADSDLEVSGQVNVSAATAVSTTLAVTYTDVNSGSQTMILPMTTTAGTFLAGGLITATGTYASAVIHIRAKASTAVTILTSAGTFTGVTYSVSAVIKRQS